MNPSREYQSLITTGSSCELKDQLLATELELEAELIALIRRYR